MNNPPKGTFQGAKTTPFLGIALTLAGRVSAILGGVVTLWLLSSLTPLATVGLEVTVGGSLLMIWSLRRPIVSLARRFWRLIPHVLDPVPLTVLALVLTIVGKKVGYVLAVATLPSLGTVNALYFGAPLIVSVVHGWRGSSTRLGRLEALAWPLVAACGVAVLTEFWTGGASGFGIVCGLVAGTCRALSLPLSRYHFTLGREELYTAVATAIAGPGILAWALLTGGDITPAGAPGTIGIVLLCGTTATLLPQFLQLLARKSVSDRLLGVLECLSPVLGALAGFALLHQGLSLIQGIGILIIVVAALGALRRGGH